MSLPPKKTNKQHLSQLLKKILKDNPQTKERHPKHLKLFAGLREKGQINNNPIPIERGSYLELVEATGRAIKTTDSNRTSVADCSINGWTCRGWEPGGRHYSIAKLELLAKCPKLRLYWLAIDLL